MYSRNGLCLSTPYSRNCRKAIAIATNPPVTLAVRVPPSAWMTSQSMITVRSPRALISTAARMERPIRRWISCVRPEGRPLVTSRGVRLAVARGSIEYSAVTQPFPLLRRNGGTVSSTVAAHNTCVLPILLSAEPSAVIRQPVMIWMGRCCPAALLSVRIACHHQVEKYHHAGHDRQDQDDAAGGALRARGLFATRPHRLEFSHKPDGSIVTDEAVPFSPRVCAGFERVPARPRSYARYLHRGGGRLASHVNRRTPAGAGVGLRTESRGGTHSRGYVRRSREARRASLPVDLARRRAGRGATLEAGPRHGLLLQRPFLRSHPVANRGPQSSTRIRRRAGEEIPRQAVSPVA